MWSLPREVQMYLVLPLLYFAAKRILSYSGALTIMACGFVVWYVDSHAARLFGYRAPLNYAPWFFMGIAAYRLYRFVMPSWSSVLYGLSLLLLVTLTCLTQRLMGDDYRAGWVSWAIGILFAFALPHFLEVRSQLIKRISHAVATYSYGIYLSHVPIMWLTFHKLSSQSLALQISLFLALQATVPIALYHGFEKPMIELGRRLGDILGGSQPNSDVLERLPAR